MKQLLINTLLILSLLLIISCDDEIPTDRPTFASNQLSTTDTTTDTTDPDDDDQALIDIPERPTDVVVINSDYCGCQGGKPITIGNCEAICASKQATTNTNQTLFFSVTLGEEITLDIYEDLAGWCGTEIIDPNTGEAVSTAVQCQMEVKNELGTVVDNLAFTPLAGTNNQSIDISNLDADQTYRLTIVETSSGARSKTFQVRRDDDDDSNTLKGPLALMPVSQYSCIFRSGTETDENTGEVTITDINTFHFYFNSETRPEPLKESTTSTVYCHDIETYSKPVSNPLLEETVGAYTLWDANDPRFYNLNGGAADGSNEATLDINDLIYDNVILQGATLDGVPNFFFEMSWPNSIDDGDSEAGSDSGTTTVTPVTKSLGFAMVPFLDDQTYKSYCPTQEHYYSDNPIFKAMRDFLSDTEALYAAKQENVIDYLLVRESVVKEIWFYIENGQHIEPTTNTIQGKKIQFYWPADPNSPFIKKSHQKVYTITAADELSGDSESTGSIVRSDYPTHDKRIACIPVLL